MRRIANIGRHVLACRRGMAALEFALLAPALLMLAFAIIVYSIYFAAQMGIRHAASEAARAAMAGLGSTERATLATTRAQQVLQSYGRLLSANGASPIVTTSTDGVGSFKVQISYNMSSSPIMRYAGFIPLPASTITANAVVTNGSY
ncbi:MAG: pilus assembly protein [Sphingobium sp.]|nr:pilus assembly protein [Sphingobium sp.]